MDSKPLRSSKVFVSFSAFSLFLAGPLLLSQAAHADTRCEAMFVVTSPTGAPPVRHPELEAESAERTSWIRAQNAKSGENFKKSSNLRPISEWIRGTYAPERVVKTTKLAEGQSLSLIQRGLGKPEQLVLKTEAGEEILFSNFAAKFDQSASGPKPRVSSFATKRNGNIHFVDFKVSTDKRYVALVLEENGSLDKFRIAIYDLKARTEVVSSFVPLETEHENISWLGTTLYFSSKKKEQAKFDLNNPAKGIVKAEDSVISEKGGVTLAWDKDYRLVQGNVVTKVSAANPEARIESILGHDGVSLFLQTETDAGVTTIEKIALPLDGKPRTSQAVVTLKDMNIEYVGIQSKHIFVEEFFGPRQSLHVYKTDGAELAKIDTPAGTGFSSYDFSKEPGLLDITLTSNVVAAETFSYDLANKRFSVPEQQVLEKMLSKDGKRYESFFVETVSSDGVKIPVRITKLKDLPRDGKNPVLMDVYGGFKISSNFYPRFSPLTADFLSRGGILVDPAIRGGNELGPEWNKQATKHNKTKTLDDLTATSRYLVAQNYTQARQIVIKGTSNGGFVVAAAGLRTPSDFGLVVAVNGVHDMLRRGTLDAPYDGYWSREYGDARNPEDVPFLLAFSPVEQARSAQNPPNFFILNGRNDSRVNPAHSFKLQRTLNDSSPLQVQMKSVNNSGHWLESPRYQGMIGWRASTFTWTAMYDHWGWRR